MKALLVVAQNDFHPAEYHDTREQLEKEDVSVEVASFETAEAISKSGNSIPVDFAIKDVNTNDYDAVVLIGGSGARRQFLGNQDVANLVKSADNDHKIVAAICIAPRVLAESGLLKNRKATVHNGDGESAQVLSCNGAHYSEEDVVVDTRFVTANGPAAAKEFGKTIAFLIKEGVGPKKEME